MNGKGDIDELVFTNVQQGKEYWIYYVASADNPTEINLWSDVKVMRAEAIDYYLGFYYETNA